MAATEAQDVISKAEKTTDDATSTKANGVDLTKPADSQLAAPQASSKAATDILPAVELITETADETAKLTENSKPTPVAKLSPEAINASADLIKDKLTNYLFLIGAPDIDTVARTIGPMSQADRQALEATYQQKFRISLRDELVIQIGEGEKFATIEAMLNRKDGSTNLAGNARIALEAMKEDPERGMRLLRSTIAPLNSAQSAEMQASYRQAYGEPLSTNIQEITASRVGADQKAIFATLLKGVDKINSADIVEMAKRAVQSRDLPMFAGVMAGDLPANVEARAALNGDSDFVAAMRKSFGTTARGRGLVQNPIAEDYLREGRVSLATILKADTAAILPYFQNAANSDLVFSNATGKERRDYVQGKELVKSGTEPKTAQEQEAKRFYEFIEKNIQGSASGTRQDVLRDELLHGGRTLISGLAELHRSSTFGFGGGHTTNELMTRVENISASEWNLLKDPAYKANLTESLKSYATADEQKQVLALIEAKLNPPNLTAGQSATFEQSQKVQRPLDQYIQNYISSAATKTSEALGHIERMTPADAARYQSDPAFKATVNNFASQYLTDRSTGNVPAQLLTSRLLEQTAQTGKPPVLGELDQFLKARAERIDSDTLLDGRAANKAQLETIGKVEDLMKDPTLLARMQNVLAVQQGEKQGIVSNEDDLLYKTFSATLGTPGNFAYLLTDGKGQSYIGTKVALSGGLAGDWLVGRYPDLAKLPEADRNRIRASLPLAEQKVLDNVIAQNGKAELSDSLRSLVIDGGSLKDFQADLAKLSNEQQAQLKADYTRKYNGDLDKDLFSSISQREGLSPEKQQVLRNTIAQNGQPQLVDDLRSFVLGSDKKFEDFQGQLASLSLPQKQELKSEYQKRYGSTLDNDFLSKVDSAHTEQYSRYLTASDTDGMQSFFERMNKFAPLAVGDGTSLSQERMLQINEGVLKQFNVNMEKLPPAIQEALADYYSKTYQNNLDSNEKYAHFVADVTLTTASIAAAIALAGPTGGISMAALATREGATLAAKLVVAGATAGAIARPTMIAAMENGTFDYSVENLAKEGLIGAVQGAMIAPIGLGGKVAIATQEAKPAASAIVKETTEATVAQRVVSNGVEREVVEQVAAPVAIEPAMALEVAARNPKPVVAPVMERRAASEVIEPAVVERAAAERAAAERAAAERAAAERAATEQAAKQTVITPAVAPLIAPVIARTVIPGLVPEIKPEPQQKTTAADTVPDIELEPRPKPEAPEKEATPEPVALKPSENLIKLATVRRGEGPWQSAERILATDGKRHSVAEVRALTRAIQATFKADNNGNGDMSGLKVKYNFVTANNYQALVNAVQDQNVKNLLLGLAIQ